MTTSGLVVPVDVLGYCVGTLDAHGPARAFAGATTDYRTQGASRGYRAVDVLRGADQAPLWPLEQGVHLHWAMPDALTRSSTQTGPLVFPPLPNRWLVSRIVGASTDVSAKHWIVTSDALSTVAPGGNNAPTVPVQLAATALAAEPTRDFRYLGGAQPFTADWREPNVTGVESLQTVTRGNLHAVATGDIAFAAFYPNARGVFGFHDDLLDLRAPAKLMYVVTGWYSTEANDPVGAGLTPAQLVSKFGWTVMGASTNLVTYSLYSGLVQRIEWDPTRRYIPDEPAPITADIAIGNHPAEALAAYFRGTQGGTPAFEELLTLYLTGLLPNLANPAAGQLAELDETLHELQFTGYDGGAIYTITRGTTEVNELPLPLADALNLLSAAQQASDAASRQAAQGKWDVFAAWHRLFQVDPPSLQAALTAFSTVIDRQTAIAGQQSIASNALTAQFEAVKAMLGDDLTLTKQPGLRFNAPTEPVVLLAGDAATPAERYGGDGRYHPAGLLECRRDTDVLTAVTIRAEKSITLHAVTYASLAPPTAGLPSPAIAALVAEAALLDTAMASAATGIGEESLATDEETWLTGGTTAHYGGAIGVPPSPVATSGWPGENPWTSLMLLWDAHYHALMPTGGVPNAGDYPPNLFTANYQIDPNSPRLIGYAPGAGGIAIDPTKINFDPTYALSGTQAYTGASVLSTTAADNLRDQLARQLTVAPDTTLQAMADLLAKNDVAMQSLTGLNDALLSRARGLQLSIGASPSAPLPFRQATEQTQRLIPSLAEIPSVAPDFNGAYNALRAGYLQLDLAVMDPFGRKRPVQVKNLYIADSLTTYVNGVPAPGIVYMPPRIAQPSRLLFRWLAGDSTEYDEMNSHPATTPVCGWLVPNHLVVGCFLYNARGALLGSLTLRAGTSGIAWQAMPGNQGTPDAELRTVMQYENPHLRDLALALGAATPKWFTAFYQALDTAVTQIAPASPTSQSGLAALVGRPLAIAQVALRLERQGFAAVDETFATAPDNFADTDHGLGGVEFPVVLGDLKRLDDGLVGFFIERGDGSYDLGTFYTEAAPSSVTGVVVPPQPTTVTVRPAVTPPSAPATSVTGVVVPPQPTTVTVRPAATPPSAPATRTVEQKLLLIVDPSAPVHATTAILPTQSLAIPPDQYADALASLELTVPAAPLLRAAGGLSVPLPAIGGFNWSWVTEKRTGAAAVWAVDPDIATPTAGAVWQYCPQTLCEGWLRLNPELLRFRLANASGQPVVAAGATAQLTLKITNARAVPITFEPGALGPEIGPKSGSVFYIHFGTLVAAAQVAAVQPAAAGWKFSPLSDEQYGAYWGATPADKAVTIAPGASFSVALGNIAVGTAAMAQARVYFDYYNVIGDDDGIDVALLAVATSR